jgi:hypothetical protein
MPEVALVTELRAVAAHTSDGPTRAALLRVRDDVVAGKHDASQAEADTWARSPEGQDTFRELRRG